MYCIEGKFYALWYVILCVPIYIISIYIFVLQFKMGHFHLHAWIERFYWTMCIVYTIPALSVISSTNIELKKKKNLYGCMGAHNSTRNSMFINVRLLWFFTFFSSIFFWNEKRPFKVVQLPRLHGIVGHEYCLTYISSAFVFFNDFFSLFLPLWGKCYCTDSWVFHFLLSKSTYYYVVLNKYRHFFVLHFCCSTFIIGLVRQFVWSWDFSLCHQIFKKSRSNAWCFFF